MNQSVNSITVPLQAIAHAHAGDKGNRCNISLIAYKKELFEYLVEQVTPELVSFHFRHRRLSNVNRYVLPRISAMNFVLENVLEGGVNKSLGLDGHGQSLSFLLLRLEVTIPSNLLSQP